MQKNVLGLIPVFLVSALFLLGLPHLAAAHSPQRMEIIYDYKTQTLNVHITHATQNPAQHFVKEVVVKKNGQVVDRKAYTRQSADGFTYTLITPATAKDTFEVTAVCSVQGSLTRKYSPGD